MSMSISTFEQHSKPSGFTSLFQKLNVDPVMLLLLLTLSGLGLVVIYSASGQDMATFQRQLVRLFVAYAVLFAIAQINPIRLRNWSPWLYIAGIGLLIAVLAFGEMGKGAQRWISISGIRFQPSEMLKLALPMMVAWYFSEKRLPPTFGNLIIAATIVVVPVLLIAKQPDLGTSLLIASSGIFAIFLAGISWHIIFACLAAMGALLPALWAVMHDYQKQRVLTFLNPESDPLGTGYHIIQSKIAIGSGGVYGKGWLNGTQSQLQFLPERHTDFIFAVYSEEFGLLGCCGLLLLYFLIIVRGMYIASQAQDTFSRLLAGSLTLTFFVYILVNMGMVSGLLPVVGVPLPLISYGGTSMVTLIAGFGIIMSVHTHRKLLST
ncbi:MAG: rod shape-determining protein RodA [Methylococcales bacterium]|jgi:rod shape determining protein RodA|nr:rod shape-determining protein RodA [Methylococcales bacterium]